VILNKKPAAEATGSRFFNPYFCDPEFGRR